MGILTWKQATEDYEKKSAGSNAASTTPPASGTLSWKQAAEEYDKYNADDYKRLGQERTAQRQARYKSQRDKGLGIERYHEDDSVNDWLNRYNQVMQGIDNSERKRNGGYTRDADSVYGAEIDALLSGYDGIKNRSDVRQYYDALKNLKDSLGAINESMAQFEDEDAYNRYMDYLKDLDEKRNLDVNAYEKEIRILENALGEYKELSRWNQDENGNARLESIRQQYGDREEMEKLLSQKRQYLTQALRIQKKDNLSAVANPESEKYDAAFESKSGYVSTEQDGKLQRMMSQYSMGYDDLTYEYINNQNGIRDTIKQKSGAYKKGETPFEAKGYDYMTEDEVGLYNYYYSMGGKASAEAYLDTIQEDLNQRKATGMYQQMEGKTGAEMVFGVEAGLDQFKSGIKGAVRAVKGDDSYVAPSATQYASGMVREDLADDGFKLPSWLGGASLGQVGYDAITTTANMAPSIAVGMLNPTLGTAALGVSAGGSAYQEALNEGYSVDQARGYGILSGASEVIMEKVLGGISAYGGNSLGKFFTQNMKNADTALKRIAKELGGSMLSEFSEEYLQEVLTPVFQNLTLGTDNEVKLVSAEALYAGFLGAITGGIMEGPQAIANSRNATAAPNNATELAKNASPELSKATVTEENSTPGGVTEQPAAVDDKMSATEESAESAYSSDPPSGKEILQVRQETDGTISNPEMVASKTEKTTPDNRNADLDNKKAVADNRNADSVTQNRQSDTETTERSRKAVQISTGRSVEVSRIVSVDQKGGMTLELSDGTTVDAGDIQHHSEGEAVLYEAVAAIGADAEVSNILVNNWKNDPGGVSAEQYTAGMIDAFNYGRYHVPQKEMSDNKSIQALTPVQRNSAYALGKSFGGQLVQTQEANARRVNAITKAQSVIKASAKKKQDNTSQKEITAKTTSTSRVNFDHMGRTLNAVQESSLQVMEMLAQATGTKFHVYESYVKDGKRVYKDATGKEKAAPSGWYESGTGEIYVDLNAGLTAEGTILYATAHELTHFIREWSPAKFDALAEAVIELVYKEKDISVIGLIREQQAKAMRTGREISFDEAYEEVVADSMESILTSGNVVEFMTQVKQKNQSLWEKIREWFKNLADDIRKLVQAYSGHKPDSPEGRTVAAMKDILPVLEGFYADALQEASENFRAAEGQHLTQTTGGRKYSYAGENARTADLDQLATAKAMQREGVSNETIRQQTGWFMGRDGKWRFEIDDSNMRVDQHGDARGAVSYKWALEDLESARDELWGHADMETLNNVRAYNRAILSGDTAEENRLHDLLINGPHAHNFSLYAEAREHVKEMSQKFGGVLHSGGQLADYVQHDALYEAYPQLQDASFRFGWLPDGTRGQYNPDDNSIIISKEIADNPERTIIHEIQHAIQKAEDFASGSSPEYWETRQRSGDSIGVNDQNIDAQMKHAQEILDSLPEDVAAEFRDWYDLNSRDENKGMVLAQELSSGQYGAQFNDYFMTTWTLEDLVKYNYSRGSNDLYRNTAGEIEARDTANRWQAGLDAEGRKNTPPDLGDDKTVFTEGNVRSEQAIGRTADNKPFVIVERDILAGVDQSQWVKTVTNNIRNKFPNGVTIGRNSIAINQRSRRELTYSEYMHKIKKEDPQLYSDKLRATDNLDEIIEATTNWISEGLKHERTDNIRDFARGNVLIRIGNNDYLAEVVVGTKANGSMLLYDILNLQKTQISDKKTDAGLTSESQNNSTDRQPTSIADSIRDSETEVNRKFSHRDPLQEKAAQALEIENQRLREDVKGLKDLVKLQGKLTGGKIMNPSSIEKAARVLKKNADAHGDTQELAGLLSDFYRYIAESNDLTWEGVKEAAQKAADWLWENRREEVDEYSAQILQDIRTRSISLSDTQKADAAVTYDTFSNYRKSLFGSVKITKEGIPLDEAWQDLANLYPGVFDENMNANDMPAALADIVSRLKSSKNMAASYDQDMMRQTLIRDVYDSYWNVSTLYTVADVKQKQINALKGRHAQQMADLRTKHRDKVAELRKERSDAVAAVRDKERQKAETRTKKVLDKYRANQEMVAANRAERKGKTELRRKIRKTVFDLEKLLNRGDKKKNVKAGMTSMVDSVLKLADALFMDEYTNRDMLRNGVGVELTDAEEKLFREAQQILQKAESGAAIEGMEFTSEVDAMNQLKKLDQKLSSKMAGLKDVFARERKRLYGTTVSDLLGKLADEYSRLSEAEDGAVRAAKDENVYAHLLQLQKDVGGTTVRDMTLNQMEAVADAFTMVLTTVRNANKMFAKNLKFKRDTLAGMVMGEIGAAVKKINKLIRPGKNAVDTFTWNNLKPVYAFERLGSETLKTLYQNIRSGQDVWSRDMQEADDFRREQYRKHNRKAWDLEKQHRFEFESGIVELSLEQIMSLYAYSRREQALDHLLKGGFVFSGSTEVMVKEHGIQRRYLKKDATAYNLTADELLQVVDALTKEQKAFVEEMQTYLSDVMGGKGNEISLQMYGIRSYGEKNYFPIRSAGQYMERAKEDSFRKEQGQISIVNSGFTKSTTPKANNPITLDGFMNVWAEHVNDMSMYHGFALPMEDFRRVYNYSSPNMEVGNSQSVNAVIENAFGKAATGYIDQLYKDLNGGALTDNREGLSKKLVGLHKKAAVFASASVVVQQPSAIVRAFALIDPRHFIGPKVDRKRHKQLWEEVKKYAPVAFVKEMGYFDTGMGRSARDFLQAEEYSGIREKMAALFKDTDYRDEILGKAPALADELTWCSIWEAVKRETKVKNPTMDVRSDAFLQIAGARFGEVIDKTQVYDSVLSRSANMRSKSGLMNMVTSFLAEPTTSINMLEDALRKGDRKQLKRTVGAVYGSVLLNSLLVSLVYAARDDDEDETYWEKYLSSVAVEMMDGINPITYYPILRDIWSIGQGFDVERADMTLISDFADAAKKVIASGMKLRDAAAEEKASALAEFKDSLWSMTDTVASLTGLPVKNIRRDIEGARNMVRTIQADLNTRDTTKLSLMDAVLGDVMNSIPIGGLLYNKSKRDRLYGAIVAKDSTYVNRLKAGYETDAAYHSALKLALRDHDSRIWEAAMAWNNNDLKGYMALAREIIAEGNFIQDDVVLAIRAEASSMEEKQSVSSSTVNGYFTTEKFGVAMSQNNTAMADIIRKDLIDTKIANGKTREEAEESVKSTARSQLRELFETGAITASSAEKMLVKYGGYEKDDAADKVAEWKYEVNHPELNGRITFSQYQRWETDGKSRGIALETYTNVVEYRGGNTSSGVRSQEDVAGYINSMPISTAQKDALWCCFWSESTLYKNAPWH